MQKFAPVRAPERDLTPRKVFESIERELRLVELEFERQASSNIQVIDYLGDYLATSGGKRVRPALLIFANLAVGGSAHGSVIRMATVMEMLHTATLVHDDIIDNADLRRNRPSLNARFGNQASVLMGDWLYMSAFETTVRERSLEIIDILTRVTRKMTEGELIQLTRIGRVDITEAEYFDILQRKTAYLFSACCEIGAILGGGDTRAQEAMRSFGMDLGIAFQLADDLLDVSADTERLGKKAGSDLLEGKLTLPLIYFLEARPEAKSAIEKVMLDGTYHAISRDALKQELMGQQTLKRIRDQVDFYVNSATKSVAILPESEYRQCLQDVLSFVAGRGHLSIAAI